MGDIGKPRFDANSEMFQGALKLAAELHAGQAKKGTDIPYISHLLGVSSIAIDYGGGETEAIAGLLHDAPEDCGGRPILEMIQKRFGPEVAEIVEACSDTFEDPKPDWVTRKVEYLVHLREASPAARLVSAADKLHNARAILKDYRAVGEKVFERFKRSKWHTMWYYRRLSDAFTAFAEQGEMESELARELDRVVRELEGETGEGPGRDEVFRELDGEVSAQGWATERIGEGENR
jgi:(p)ppGpp synthase/HD superfamily hydrolase